MTSHHFNISLLMNLTLVSSKTKWWTKAAPRGLSSNKLQEISLQLLFDRTYQNDHRLRKETPLNRDGEITTILLLYRPADKLTQERPGKSKLARREVPPRKGKTFCKCQIQATMTPIIQTRKITVLIESPNQKRERPPLDKVRKVPIFLKILLRLEAIRVLKGCDILCIYGFNKL